jgi:hypothetical protein
MLEPDKKPLTPSISLGFTIGLAEGRPSEDPLYQFDYKTYVIYKG